MTTLISGLISQLTIGHGIAAVAGALLMKVPTIYTAVSDIVTFLKARAKAKAGTTASTAEADVKKAVDSAVASIEAKVKKL